MPRCVHRANIRQGGDLTVVLLPSCTDSCRKLSKRALGAAWMPRVGASSELITSLVHTCNTCLTDYMGRAVGHSCGRCTC